MQRYGMTIPLDGVPLHAQREYFEELAALGYTDLWTSEAGGTDGFTPLALASTWAPAQRLGCAIFPAYTRGPALLAMSAASLAQAAPGRFVLGVGSSSNVIVQNWNGIPFEKPYQKTRDLVRFLRRAFTGEKVSEAYETFEIKNFRLGVRLDEPPKILVAALRQGMLRLAGREGDGAILNWLSADDVKRVVPLVKESGDDKEIVARIFVCPNPDTDQVRQMARFAVNAYLNVPVYAAYHEWLGRTRSLREMWDKWSGGDRRGAAAAIPDEVVDELIVHGTPEECRAHIQRYVDNGVDTPALSIMPLGVDPRQAARDLAPTAGS
ncbi:MAG: LLM class F420-dependent oxidoreductase [Myxococcales bacterium]|nr:LLM class F420-dependent oxidoreductase [Myxococcales bacterium]